MNRDLIKLIFKRVVILFILVLVFSFFIVGDFKSSFLGYLFGTSISMINFIILKNSIEKSVKMSPSDAKKYGSKQYYFRMMIYGVVLIIAALADYLNFLYVVLGIFMVKLVIVLSTIFDKDFLK